MKNKISLITSVFIILSLVFPSARASAEFDTTSLITSYDPDNYAKLSLESDTINVSGKFTDDIVTGVGVNCKNETNYEFHVDDSGEFVASITAAPIDKNYAGCDYSFYIVFNSGLAYYYTLEYDKGWRVPDNGLCAANEAKFDNIVTAEPLACAYYISESADPNEIELACEELERIVDEVCADEEDDYKKAYLLNRWVGENIAYDHDAAETAVTMNTIAVYNVLTNRRTTCAGFANTYSALLETAGIRSVNLKGAAAAGDITYETLATGTENHEFSAFWYEKEQRWVYTDPCWTSLSSYKNGAFSFGDTYGKYFDISGEAFALDHRIDKAEERNYLSALEALLNDGETIETQTDAAEDTAETAETAEASNTEQSEEPEQSEGPAEESDPDDLPKVLFIIAGALGAAILVLGIILAVKSKNNKRNG